MSLSSISGTGLNMCGLAGFLGYGGLNGEEVRRITKQMGDSLHTVVQTIPVFGVTIIQR